jgi:hypothetical protein
LPVQHEEAHLATKLAEKAAAGLRAATAFLYALTRARLSPLGVKKQSAGAPAFETIN